MLNRTLRCLVALGASSLTGGLVGCGSSGTGNATPTTSATVALDLYDGNGNKTGTCAGTLIAPDVVLTAGHCVVGQFWWQATLPATGQSAHGSVAFTYDWENFDSDLSHPLHHDLAVVKLDSGLSVATYPALATSALANGAAAMRVRQASTGFDAVAVQAFDGAEKGFPDYYYTSFDGSESLQPGAALLDPATNRIYGVVSGKGMTSGLLYLSRVEEIAQWLADKAACDPTIPVTAVTADFHLSTECNSKGPPSGSGSGGSSGSSSGSSSGGKSSSSSGSGSGSGGWSSSGSSSGGSSGSSSGTTGGSGSSSGTSGGSGSSSGTTGGSGGNASSSGSGGASSGGIGTTGDGGSCGNGGGTCVGSGCTTTTGGGSSSGGASSGGIGTTSSSGGASSSGGGSSGASSGSSSGGASSGGIGTTSSSSSSGGGTASGSGSSSGGVSSGGTGTTGSGGATGSGSGTTGSAGGDGPGCTDSTCGGCDPTDPSCQDNVIDYGGTTGTPAPAPYRPY